MGKEAGDAGLRGTGNSRGTIVDDGLHKRIRPFPNLSKKAECIIYIILNTPPIANS